MQHTTFEDIYLEAVERFPFPELQPTSHAFGELEANERGEIDYGEEFLFSAGEICNMLIQGGGWIECRVEDGTLTISGTFSLARNGDWGNGRILSNEEYLQGWYDLTAKCWSFDFGVL